jgi:uncharacterized heparinase superfamily protein/O-antigen/teichoic acid export membrane protein
MFFSGGQVRLPRSPSSPGSQSTGFGPAPNNPRLVDPARGQALITGSFTFAGVKMSIGAGGDPWDRPSPNLPFAAHLHSFDWLGDLMAAGQAGAAEAVRLTLAWQAVFGRGNAFSWQTHLTERRVFNLACHGREMASTNAPGCEQISPVILGHARRLLTVSDRTARAAERLTAVALAGVSLNGPAGQTLLKKGLSRLEGALNTRTHLASRPPKARLELLMDLLTLEDGLSKCGQPHSEAVSRTIDQLAELKFTRVAGDEPTFSPHTVTWASSHTVEMGLALPEQATSARTTLKRRVGALRRLGQRFREDWLASSLRDSLLQGPKPTGFSSAAQNWRPVDPDRGRALMSGVFVFVGRTMTIGVQGNPWDRPSPDIRFAARLHSFDWLGDLMALGASGATEAARLMSAWRTIFGRWNAFAWRADLIERRVFHLACHARAMAAAAPAERQHIAASLARQARHLLTISDAAPRAAERLTAAALAGSTLAGAAGAQILARALPRLRAALAANERETPRTAQARLELLLDLLALEEGLIRSGRPADETVSQAIDQLADLRFTRQPGGVLAAVPEATDGASHGEAWKAGASRVRLTLVGDVATARRRAVASNDVVASSRKASRGFLAGASMVLRLLGLAGRLALTLYIARYLGLTAMASYGFVIGASAATIAISGLGLDYRVSRYSIHRKIGLVTQRIRDRAILRMLVAAPLIVSASWLLHFPLAPLLIVLVEPISYDMQQVSLYRHRPLEANAMLFARSAWIPVVLALGLTNPHWRSMTTVFWGWSASVVLSLVLFVTCALLNPKIRRGAVRKIDWDWLRRNAAESKLAYLSEIGFVAMVYADRYIIGWRLGAPAAGIFVFLWSCTNAIVPLVQAGAFDQLSPSLSLAWRERGRSAWTAAVTQGLQRTLALSIILCLAEFIAIFVFRTSSSLIHLRFELPLLTLMMLATVIRLSADWLHLALWSAERDRDWVRVNIFGLVISPIVALASIATFGLIGAGLEMVLSSSLALALRYQLMRDLLKKGASVRLTAAGAPSPAPATHTPIVVTAPAKPLAPTMDQAIAGLNPAIANALGAENSLALDLAPQSARA